MPDVDGSRAPHVPSRMRATTSRAMAPPFVSTDIMALLPSLRQAVYGVAAHNLYRDKSCPNIRYSPARRLAPKVAHL